MINMTIRNMKLFFRDKAGVFFSFLSVIIIIGLYVFFIKDLVKSGYMENLVDIDIMINSWVSAGILSVISITVTLGAFGVMVDDRVRKISKDFYSSPIKRSGIAGGYVFSAYAIGVIMSIVAFILAELYIVLTGGAILPFVSMLKILGLILLTVLASSSIMLFIVSFFKSQNAFSTTNVIVGTLAGFLLGVYVPIGILPDTVQTIIKVFPISHAAALFRQVFVETPMAVSFKDVPAEIVTDIQHQLGIVLQAGINDINTITSIIYLVVTAVVFYLLSVFVLSKKHSQ